jgi:hypothetical protein
MWVLALILGDLCLDGPIWSDLWALWSYVTQQTIFRACFVCVMCVFPWFVYMGTCISQFTKTCGVG